MADKARLRITFTGTPRQRAVIRTLIVVTAAICLWFVITTVEITLGVRLAWPWLAAVGGMAGFATVRALNRAVRWMDGAS